MKKAVKKTPKKPLPPTIPRTPIIVDQDSGESQASVDISNDDNTHEPLESVDPAETVPGDEKAVLWEG